MDRMKTTRVPMTNREWRLLCDAYQHPVRQVVTKSCISLPILWGWCYLHHWSAPFYAAGSALPCLFATSIRWRWRKVDIWLAQHPGILD